MGWGKEGRGGQGLTRKWRKRCAKAKKEEEEVGWG